MLIINYFLIILFVITIIVISIDYAKSAIKKQKKREKPILIRESDINCFSNDNAKTLLLQLYSSNRHYQSVHTTYIAIFVAITSIIIVLYQTFIDDKNNILYTIASSALMFFIFIYIIIINAYIKIYNSYKFIHLLENNLDIPVTKILNYGYYKSLGNSLHTINILNIIIFFFIYFIVLFGVVKSTLTDNEQIYITIGYTIIYIIFGIIIYKKIQTKNNDTVEIKDNTNN